MIAIRCELNKQGFDNWIVIKHSYINKDWLACFR